MSDEEDPCLSAAGTHLSPEPLDGPPSAGKASSDGSPPPVRWLESHEPLVVPPTASAIVLFQKIPDEALWRYSAFINGGTSLPIASGDVLEHDVILAILPPGEFDSRAQMSEVLDPLLCAFLAGEGMECDPTEGPPVVWS